MLMRWKILQCEVMMRVPVFIVERQSAFYGRGPGFNKALNSHRIANTRMVFSDLIIES